MAADTAVQVKPDPALKRFFSAVDWAVVATGHNTQLEREMKVGTRGISRVSWKGHSGYKREWGRFWKSENESLRWRNIPSRRAQAAGIQYDPAISAPWKAAGRRTSEFLLKKFRTRKVATYASFLVNLASYSGHVLGAVQAVALRRRGWVNVVKAVRFSERARARITERALVNAAKKAGAKT